MERCQPRYSRISAVQMSASGARALRTDFRVHPFATSQTEHEEEECGFKTWLTLVLALTAGHSATNPANQHKNYAGVPSSDLSQSVASAQAPLSVSAPASHNVDARPSSSAFKLFAASTTTQDYPFYEKESENRLFNGFLNYTRLLQGEFASATNAADLFRRLMQAYVENPSLLISHVLNYSREHSKDLFEVGVPGIKFVVYGVVCRVVCVAASVTHAQKELLGLYRARKTLARNIYKLLKKVKRLVKAKHKGKKVKSNKTQASAGRQLRRPKRMVVVEDGERAPDEGSLAELMARKYKGGEDPYVLFAIEVLASYRIRTGD